MKDKKLKPEEYENYIKPDEELTFSKDSLAESITLPKSSIGNSIHGSLTARGVQGTIYVTREGNESASALKTDEYSFSGSRGDEIELIGPLKNDDYHHLPDLPDFMKHTAPDWLNKLIRGIKNKFGSYSGSLSRTPIFGEGMLCAHGGRGKHS